MASGGFWHVLNAIVGFDDGSGYVSRAVVVASNVALVRNLKTGYISPQFHVIFDNWFETVGVDDDVTPPAVWDVLVTHSHFHSNVDDSDLDGLELDDEWLSTDELIVRSQLHARLRSERLPGLRDSPQSSESPASSCP